MSHVGKVEIDVHLNASAEQFHQIFSRKPHHIANITPGKMKGVTKHQGDFGKVGSITEWHYVHGKFNSFILVLKSNSLKVEATLDEFTTNNICYMDSSYIL